MIVHREVEQGSFAWHKLRLGIPTASCFDKILTPAGKPSRQAESYLNELLAEWMIGRPIPGPETQWMVRGHDLEEDAVNAYEFHANATTAKVGLITSNDGMVGASPDRLVEDDRLLEIKCPKHSTHAGYMLTGKIEDEYRPQLQGQLWITERRAVDIVSYYPELPPVVISVERDEAYIEALALAVGAFVGVMIQQREILQAMYGPFARAEMSRKEALLREQLAARPGFGADVEEEQSMGVPV